ncbi:v-SNARE protein-like protein Bos1 [Setomelanomma holmii]|uniref:Protein transport protein BOS1 n=1 Tax=Setomelanomma holmii TaxID=210430 RepID=A0A9P4GWQ2_9PLEO|nr:v-SNARE protein-like protein Bos1 [Setomelanomma holmii]
MNALFNTALRQSTAIRKDLDQFADTAAPSPHLQAQLNASLTTFARTIDDYGKLAKQEPVQTKQEKAFERLKNFRAELEEYRSSFKRIKSANEDIQTTEARTELLGRRPHHAATPENPYSLPSASAAQHSPFAPANYNPAGPYRPNAYSAGAPQGGNYDREGHVLRENTFFKHTSDQLDEFLDRGRAVLGDLGQQREMLKGTQRRLYSVANTLGISGDTIRMVERRAKQDKWIFWTGVVVFFAFCWLVIHYLR